MGWDIDVKEKVYQRLANACRSQAEEIILNELILN